MLIEVKSLSKNYGKKQALNDLTFSLTMPKIYGLLGRNGAGKTTFLQMLAGHMYTKHGEILVNNEHPFDNRNILQSICFIKEANNFYKDMRIKHILKSYSIFYPTWNNELAEKLLKDFKLNKKARVKTLSKGMASSLGVLVGLASRAPITIFDEPYIGMDAAARKHFYDVLLDEYEKKKRTIILSTHLIDEVSLLFEEIIILKEGELMLQEEADRLRKQTYVCIGPVEEVKPFISNKQVIRTEQLANMMTAYVCGDRKEAEEANLKTDGIPIQDLMIYLTESERSV